MTTKKTKGGPVQRGQNPINGNATSIKSQSKKHRSKQLSQPDKSVSSFITWRKHGLGYAVLVLTIAAVFGILHSMHIARMFENERFFSHLSPLERELSFRTEMGLYYSYYKTVVEAPTFLDGLHSIMNCNMTEYPDTINTLKRFNLYPEVLLGLGFRVYTEVTSFFNIQTKVCYTVNRGYNQPPVQSCEGLGELSFFYVYVIFYLTGLMMSCFFLLCFYLSGNILGGILGVACYFFNHGEATRVMWTPPLRESFSYPFLVAQMLALTLALKSPKVNWRHTFLIAITTILFMIPWQFAQFALLTQTCAVFALYSLRFITTHKYCNILYGLMVGHFVNFIFQFGNSMLLSSFFLSALITSLILAKLEDYVYRLPHQIIIWIVQGLAFVSGTVGIKMAIAKLMGISDDAHIANILRSKFSSFRDFHTSLYTCAPEFDFLEPETFTRLSKTLLLPAAVISVCAVLVKVAANQWRAWKKNGEQNSREQKSESIDDSEEDLNGRMQSNPKLHAEHVYHILQTFAFVLMAVIIMRLKLFGTPALCVMASLLSSRTFFGFLGDKRSHYAIVIVILAVMSVQGSMNLQQQFNTQGEYNNPDLESLIDWINRESPKHAVFAGAMPTMATVKLTTGRAVVNHPHYEDVGIRERTHRIYQIFSRKPPSDVWRTLDAMKVTHVIVDSQWCMGRPKPGCGMADIWDLEDEENAGREVCCRKLTKRPLPFTRAFKNDKYAVYQLRASRMQH